MRTTIIMLLSLPALACASETAALRFGRECGSLATTNSSTGFLPGRLVDRGDSEGDMTCSRAGEVLGAPRREIRPGSGAPDAVKLTAPISPTEKSASSPKSPTLERAGYQRYCLSCHGKAGDGHGSSAKRFESAATDFTRGAYKCRSTPSATLPTDDDLRRSIRDGLFNSGMPPFVAVGPLQIHDLVVLLKSFSVRFQREPQGHPIAIPPGPPSDATTVARGAAIYDRLKCANCHGPLGRGGGPGASNLRNDDGTEAHLTDLATHYKCGETPVDLYRTLMTGLDGTPMSSYAETIEPAETWDLVHFVLSLKR